jgi:hypothetical protein
VIVLEPPDTTHHGNGDAPDTHTREPQHN